MSLLTESDFKERPAHAFLRRIQWRLHWLLHPDNPVVVRNWWDGVEISVPNSKSAAHVFYRQRVPIAKARLLKELLGEGMVVMDVGAHIGAYTVVFSRIVGGSGCVYAFEPQADLADWISGNASRNQMSNCVVVAAALGNTDGEVNFRTDARSKGGWTTNGGADPVPCTTLDSFIATRRLDRLDFIKLDAAGNELAVLLGGARCLRNLRPSVHCALYHPEVVRERHGYQITEIPNFFHDFGYEMFLCDEVTPDRRIPVGPGDDVTRFFGKTEPYGYVLVAKPRAQIRI